MKPKFPANDTVLSMQRWELMNTAVLTGRQVSQPMKVLMVSQGGDVADITLHTSCSTPDMAALKVSDVYRKWKMFNPFSTFLICGNVSSSNAANQQQSDREDVDKIGLQRPADSPKYSKVKIDIEAIYNKFNFKIPSNQFFSKFSSYSPPPPPPGGIYLN